MAEEYKETRETTPAGNTRVYRRQTYTDRADGYYDSTRSSGYRVLYYLLNILEVLLGLRFLFRLLAANPGSPFVSFLYSITNPFIAPFRGIFAPAASFGSVLEWSTLVAMIIYALIVYAVVRLIDIVARPV